MMKEQLSLVELATYGYDPARVKKDSWLEQTYGNKQEEVRKNEHIGRPDQDKVKRTGRRPDKNT